MLVFFGPCQYFAAGHAAHLLKHAEQSAAPLRFLSDFQSSVPGRNQMLPPTTRRVSACWMVDNSLPYSVNLDTGTNIDFGFGGVAAPHVWAIVCYF